MCILSIIVPFYNSEKKCLRLLNTLSKIDDQSVELILVDDGSTDGTLNLLKDLKNASKLNVHILSQENKGPGGARNNGIRIASGKYLWFVDSDDDIKIEAIDFLKQHYTENFDFIDFDLKNIHGQANSMNIPSGKHDESQNISITLLKNFGRIWTKHIRRDLIIANKIYYPEYSNAQDNALTFIYPFFITSFYKTNIIGYHHYEEFPSVTRCPIGPRYFDRIYTAMYGLKKALQLANKDESEFLYRKLVNLYLNVTAAKNITRTPPLHWLSACRVMRMFRSVAFTYGINFKKYPRLRGSWKFEAIFKLLWFLSYLLPDQEKHFDKLRMLGWGRPFCEP